MSQLSCRKSKETGCQQGHSQGPPSSGYALLTPGRSRDGLKRLETFRSLGTLVNTWPHQKPASNAALSVGWRVQKVGDLAGLEWSLTCGAWEEEMGFSGSPQGVSQSSDSPS